MSETKHARVLILLWPCRLYSMRFHAARANLEPVLIQGMQLGGQLSITTDVENYPGFEDAVMGPWLMEQMQKQAENVGTEMIFDMVTSVELDQRPFKLHGDSGTLYTCDVLIICTGAQAKWLGLESETEYRGFGVSACATCDGSFIAARKWRSLAVATRLLRKRCI